QAQEAAQPLPDDVVARPLRVRPVPPHARDRAIDQARIELREPRIADAELVGDTGTEILDEHIGVGDELLDDGTALRVAQIEGEAALAAIEGAIHRRVAAALIPAAKRIATFRVFDLDDLGAEIGEELSGIGPGDETRRLDHAIAGKRPE